MPILIRCTVKCGYCGVTQGAAAEYYTDSRSLGGDVVLEGEWVYSKRNDAEVYCSEKCRKLGEGG